MMARLFNEPAGGPRRPRLKVTEPVYLRIGRTRIKVIPRPNYCVECGKRIHPEAWRCFGCARRVAQAHDYEGSGRQPHYYCRCRGDSEGRFLACDYSPACTREEQGVDRRRGNPTGTLAKIPEAKGERVCRREGCGVVIPADAPGNQQYHSPACREIARNPGYRPRTEKRPAGEPRYCHHENCMNQPPKGKHYCSEECRLRQAILRLERQLTA